METAWVTARQNRLRAGRRESAGTGRQQGYAGARGRQADAQPIGAWWSIAESPDSLVSRTDQPLALRTRCAQRLITPLAKPDRPQSTIHFAGYAFTVYHNKCLQALLLKE